MINTVSWFFPPQYEKNSHIKDIMYRTLQKERQKVVQLVKNLPASAEDVGSIPGSGRSPGGGNDNPLQYSCLEHPMHRGAWLATVCVVTKSWTRLGD